MSEVKTILIVDDDKGFQFYLASLFEDNYPNTHIVQAFDGEEAIQSLEQMDKYPGLVFVDLNMPIMSGYEFLCMQKLQFQAQGSKVIVLTSSRSEEDYKKVKNLGFVYDYLEKEVFKNALRKHMDKW